MSVRRAAIVLSILVACKARSSEADTETLAREALVAEGCQVSAVDARTLRVTCGDAGDVLTVALENLDAQLKALPDRDARKQAVAKFVGQLVHARDEKAPESTPTADLRLALKTKAGIEASFARVPPDVRAKNRLPMWPVGGEVVSIVVIDRPETMAMVMQPALDRWKTTDEAVYAKALENLEARPLTPQSIVRNGATLAVLDDPQDAYEAARIVSAKARGDLEKAVNGHAVFAIPDREHLVAAKANDPAAVRALREYAAELAPGAYGITADLFEADASGKLHVVR